MKKLLLVLSIASMVAMVSCQKELPEAPGYIPGMGDEPGDLQVQAAYNLPQDVVFVGDITGAIETSSNVLKSASTVNYTCYGSGHNQVRLKMCLENKSDKKKTVCFPKGLVWKCDNSNVQHGILVQHTWFCLQPNSQRTVELELYCVNYGRETSSTESTYGCLGITSSNTIWNLLNLIGKKKVNYECWYGNSSATSLKSVSDDAITYEAISTELQAAVWNLTNFGNDLTEEQKAFIQAIPDLEEGTYPESLFADPSVIPAEPFDEYADAVAAQ
jgi:hypothetical protein